LSTGIDNTSIGYVALTKNTTGIQNTAIGRSAMENSTTGNANTAVGFAALYSNTTGIDNTGIGYFCESGNFNGSVILGRDAAATGNNQFVVGSAGTNAGAITTEVVVSDTTWSVRINGTAYKILLKA
jgi:hypothetical protein